jgi:PleD family two-component response regulator
VDMPEMDGLTVLRTIKQHAGLRDVPVLMYSANPQTETMVEAKRLGAVDFVTKGTVALPTFAARIGELVGQIANPLSSPMSAT